MEYRKYTEDFTDEERQCFDALKTNHKPWICYGNDLIKIKHFVENVVGEDFHFSIERNKTVFGTENVVRPLTK